MSCNKINIKTILTLSIEINFIQIMNFGKLFSNLILQKETLIQQR